MWFAQGFVQDEDVALRKAVADYEKASGNKIELSIIPFAPMRQKIISAITSGVVPDVIHKQPGRDPAAVRLARQVGRRRATSSRRRRRSSVETALQCRPGLQQRHQEAQPITACRSAAPCVPCHIWQSAGREGRLQDGGHPEDLGRAISTSSRRCRTICASRASARSMGSVSR